MGPLDGIHVVELDHEHTAWTGKLLADLGAAVTLVEPPGGSPQRARPPFLDDEPGPERSLWWWHYHTSKRSVVAAGEQLGQLIADADVVLEAGDALADAGFDRERLRADDPRLIVATITPFGIGSARADEPVTDLTLLAEGGPVWNCGYDDHTLPPVRGAGGQALHTGGNWAAMTILVALLAREETGTGQHIDVNMLAAANVTTEVATYGWLMVGEEPFRQTGRHAASTRTAEVQVRCRDGRYATTGVPPRDPATFRRIVELLDRRGWRDEFPSTVILELAGELERPFSFADALTDPMVVEYLTSARDVLWFLAEHLDAYDFFVETQTIGLATGVIYTPGEAITDPHFVARGFPVEIDHPELGRSITYPGAPYRFTATPWSAHRAPTTPADPDA